MEHISRPFADLVRIHKTRCGGCQVKRTLRFTIPLRGGQLVGTLGPGGGACEFPGPGRATTASDVSTLGCLASGDLVRYRLSSRWTLVGVLAV